MKLKSKTFVSKRRFLNRSEGIAACSTHLAADEYSVDSTVRITDCSRQICLEFYADNKTAAAARKRKLANLIADLQLLHDSYDKAWDYHVEQAAIAKANRKAEGETDEEAN